MKKSILLTGTVLILLLCILLPIMSENIREAIIDPPKAIHYIFRKAKTWHVSFKITKQYDKEEVYITMRDGIKLFTSIYSPKDNSETYPILLWRTPYSSELSVDKYSHRLPNMKHLLMEKYILVFQDVRGRYLSEGDFEDIRPYKPNKIKNETDENSDAFDTIDWMINNIPNNNGNVGIFGISYPGFYSVMALPNAHPSLKAVSPQGPVIDWFCCDDWHHNGAFFLLDAFTFFEQNGRPRKYLKREHPPAFEYQGKDINKFFKDIGPIKNIQKEFFGDSIQFWSELMTHSTYDEFWQERNILPHLSDIKPAVLIVGGWFDAEDLMGPLKLYKAIETQNKTNNQNRLIFGPWYHGQWSRGFREKVGNINFKSKTSEYFKEVELQFFNYYLKNKGEMNLPEASIFITGANEWREFDTWPPDNLIEETLYLRCNGQLVFSKPQINECYNEYLVDPNSPVPYVGYVHTRRLREYLTDDQRFSSHRPDVVVFQTEILENDIAIVGPLKVKLFVSTTGTDADYIVKMIDVFPEQLNENSINETEAEPSGYQMLVRGEIMRGKFRNCLETPEPFVPGKVTEVSFEMPDIAHQFRKGHRIMIQVQNSWFPLVDINPQQFLNIYEADQKDFIKATHRIYHDLQRPSKISFDILKN